MEKFIRPIAFGIIAMICIFAIIFGISSQFPNDNSYIENTPSINDSNEQLANDFKNIFENTIDYQGYNVNIAGITKINADNDLVYTWASKVSAVDNKYDLDLNIPRINISSTSAQKFNDKIKEIYVNKANDIILNSTSNTIYTVEYMSYINANILSLVIKSTLKEGNNPQRVIIQTYNYNLSTNEEITFKQMLEIKGLQESVAKNTILNKIEASNKEAQNLKNLGYNVYIRDLSSNIYEISNTTYFILGKDNNLYVIYPYGNSNFTDEIDVIVF